MIWTRETPTLSGWYWWRLNSGDDLSVAEVVYLYFGLAMTDPRLYRIDKRWSVLASHELEISEWSGPIEHPDGPRADNIKIEITPLALTSKEIERGVALKWGGEAQ